MIKVERPTLGDAVGAEILQRAGVARQVLIDAFNQRTKPEIKDDIYKAYKDFLLQAFHKKCAYCENVISAAQPGDVEHYRPKNRVSDNALKPLKANYPEWGEIEHMGYFWLAYDWDNLLPSCIDCNRYRISGDDGRGYGKGDRFPVDGFRACLPGQEADEVALLIDPTKIDPNEHLTFYEDGTIQAKTQVGLETINLLGLNTRETLVRERRAQYRNASRAFAELLEEGRGDDEERIDELKQEVNGIWAGSGAYTAFSRVAINDIRANYKRLGVDIPMPIN